MQGIWRPTHPTLFCFPDDEKANAETNESGTKTVASAAKNASVSTSATATASDKKNETTGGDASAMKDASTGKGNAEGSQGTTGTAEGGKSAGGTGGAASDAAASSTSQAEDQSDEIWQVVDNDELGDLLRGVAEVDEEDDDKEAMLERYDKFRHTEKNGIESAAASSNATGDSATSKAVGATATNGGGGTVDTATNGDSSSNKEAGKVEG